MGSSHWHCTLQGADNVQLLSLQHNSLLTLDGLQQLPQLAFLDAYANHLTGLQALQPLTTLRVLFLGRNQLTDLTGAPAYRLVLFAAECAMWSHCLRNVAMATRLPHWAACAALACDLSSAALNGHVTERQVEGCLHGCKQ